MATIQGIYIALFGRPADPLGLAFWEAQTNNGADLTKLVNGDPATGLGPLVGEPEYTDRFAGQSNVQIVNSIYVSLFGHDADVAGLSFYVNLLATGQATIADIAIKIYDGAQGTDLATLENKEIAADQFTAEIDTTAEIVAYNDTTLHLAQDYLTGITDDPTTIPTEAQAEAVVQNIVDLNASSGTTGDTFVLETGPEIHTGGAANDLFVALQGGGADDTLDAGDELNGSSGTDTLRVVNTASLGDDIDLSVAEITGIERADIRISNDNFNSLNLNDDDGAFTSLDIDFNGGDQGNVTVESLSANSTITVRDADFGGNTLEFDFSESSTASAVDGTLTLTDLDDTYVYMDFDVDADGSDAGDTYTINLDNVQNSNNGTSLDFGDIENINLNVLTDSELEEFLVYYTSSGDDLGPQTININLTGDLTVLSDFDTNDDDDATINITGAGNFTIGDWGSADHNLVINADTATGNIDLGSLNSNAESYDITLGSGTDHVAFDAGVTLADVTADGGAGIDVFGVDFDDAVDIADADISGFETLELTGTAAGNIAVDADDNGFDNVLLSGDVGAGFTLTVEDLSGDVTIAASQAGAVVFTPEGASDHLGVTLDAGTATMFAVDVSDYTEVTFTSDSATDDTTFTTLTADDLDTLAFAGEGDIDINGLSAASLGTLDLSAMEGVFTNDGAAIANTLGTVQVGNVGDGSEVELAAGGSTDFVFGAELDNTFNIDNFDGGVGGDVLDLSALGIENFADMTVANVGANVEITADEFSGTITLLGIQVADLDGTANFVFA